MHQRAVEDRSHRIAAELGEVDYPPGLPVDRSINPFVIDPLLKRWVSALVNFEGTVADDAFEITNETAYGLTTGIMCRYVDRAEPIADQVEAGRVHVIETSLNEPCNTSFGAV